MTFQEEVRLKKAKICLQQALTDYVDSLLINGDCHKAFALYDRQTDASLRIKAYSVLMECGDCASAQDWLSSFNPEDDEMMDYVTVQGINIKRLCNPRTFTPSEEDLYTLYPLTQEVYPYAAYARSLWHILTGESIFLPLPGITRDVKQRSVSDDAGSWSLYPNPTSGQLTITFDAPIESGQILITDQLGRCIKEHVIEKQSEYQLNVSNYDSGVHYVRVSTGDRLVFIDKFIVQ